MTGRSLSDAALIDEDSNGTISKEELHKYIEQNAKLWAMLSVSLNLPEDRCRDIATTVAFQFAKKKRGKLLEDLTPTDFEREPTLKEVQRFLDHVKKPKGEQEFFHRTIFQAFDADDNGVLDQNEVDMFLNIFYEADSIFAGDARLPDKEELKKRVWAEFDENGDGELNFYEIRTLMTGGAQSLTAM